MNQLELNNLVSYWKTVLGLGDWCIKATFVSSKRKTGEAVAALEYFDTTKDAKVYILRYEKRKGRLAKTLRDYEVDLVHELLHIHLDDHWNPTVREPYIAKERYIEATARALVALSRGNPYLFHPKEEEVCRARHKGTTKTTEI